MLRLYPHQYAGNSYQVRYSDLDELISAENPTVAFEYSPRVTLSVAVYIPPLSWGWYFNISDTIQLSI